MFAKHNQPHPYKWIPGETKIIMKIFRNPVTPDIPSRIAVISVA